MESGKNRSHGPRRDAAAGRTTLPSRLLVADDEHLIASDLAETLRALGYEVIGPAADGVEAIALCEREQPDMALLDIRMAKKDGMAAAQLIFGELGVPVMIFSAYSDQEYVESGARVGIFGYLLKPVSKDQLRVAIPVAWSRYMAFTEQHGQILALKERLEQRKLIEQAKWIIVKRKAISEPEAMRLLQAQARNNRRPMIDIATMIVESETLLGE
jgi:two-component system, response regulator PdtaR